jgi:hypothetical protein
LQRQAINRLDRSLLVNWKDDANAEKGLKRRREPPVAVASSRFLPAACNTRSIAGTIAHSRQELAASSCRHGRLLTPAECRVFPGILKRQQGLLLLPMISSRIKQGGHPLNGSTRGIGELRGGSKRFVNSGGTRFGTFTKPLYEHPQTRQSHTVDKTLDPRKKPLRLVNPKPTHRHKGSGQIFKESGRIERHKRGPKWRRRDKVVESHWQQAQDSPALAPVSQFPPRKRRTNKVPPLLYRQRVYPTPSPSMASIRQR